MNFGSVQKWLDSPSNQTAVMALVATAAGAISQYTDHSTSLSTAVGAIVFAVVKALVPDNIVLQKDLQATSVDLVNQVNSKTTTSTPLVVPITKATP
jgi:hypothetical protein